MKKLFAIALVTLMIVTLVACAGTGSKPSTDTGKDTGGQQTENGSNNNASSGAIVGVKSDLYAPNVGSQADKYWHVKEIEQVNEFDKDGKCTVRDTVYYLKNVSDYEDTNAELEGGGWKPVWSADKSYFSIDAGFKDYTSVEDAIDDMERNFRGYTLTYENGSTKHIDPPSDDEKVKINKEIFGFTFDDIETSYGQYEYTYTRFRDKVMVTYIDGATVEDINALAKDAFDVCLGIADEGKIYNYLGKYGDELTESPTVDSIFESATFNYYKDGKEITVQAEILQSEGFDSTLALLVSVMN